MPNEKLNMIISGITVVTGPCCKISASTGLCIEKQAPCPVRGKHSFFDGFHPTEKASLPTGMRGYRAVTPLDVYPMDIHHLAQLP